MAAACARLWSSFKRRSESPLLAHQETERSHLNVNYDILKTFLLFVQIQGFKKRNVIDCNFKVLNTNLTLFFPQHFL